MWILPSGKCKVEVAAHFCRQFQRKHTIHLFLTNFWQRGRRNNPIISVEVSLGKQILTSVGLANVWVGKRDWQSFVCGLKLLQLTFMTVLMDLKGGRKIAVRCYVNSLVESQNVRAISDLSDQLLVHNHESMTTFLLVYRKRRYIWIIYHISLKSKMNSF